MSVEVDDLIKMDALDQQLLALLRADARASVATLAGKLKVSRGTVTNRIARLEDSGVITGYTVRLRPDTMPDQITAWMSITVEGNRTREVVAMLLGEPGITGLFDTNGRWDLVVELGTATLTDFDAVLRRIRLIPGITGSETSLLLATPRTTRARLA